MAPPRKTRRPAEAGPAGEVVEEKAKVQRSVVQQIIDEMGDAATTLSDEGLSIHLPGVISSGSEWLDWALGRGGWPLSRIVLVGGAEGLGKTSLALHAASNCQRAGGVVAYLDGEMKLDGAYAAALGVNTSQLIMPPPRDEPMSVEESAEFVAKVSDQYLATSAHQGIPFLFVYDSISSFLTESEKEGKDALGSQARAMSILLKRVNPRVSRSAMCMLFLSQMRSKIGGMKGDEETTSGGRAPRFYASTILHLSYAGAIRTTEGGDTERVGTKTRVTVVKNQVAAPFRKCEYDIRFGQGIDYPASVVGLADQLGFTKVKGSWTTFVGPGSSETDPLKWSGIGGFRGLMEERPEAFQQILDLIRSSYSRVE